MHEAGRCYIFQFQHSYFPDDVIEIVKKVEKDSENGQNGPLSIALNYGARAEILRAITLLKNSGEDITEENFEELFPHENLI